MATIITTIATTAIPIKSNQKNCVHVNSPPLLPVARSMKLPSCLCASCLAQPWSAKPGFVVNGKPITVQVDTMYTGTLLVYPTSVDKLGLATESQSKTSKFFAFTDGGVDMFVSKANQLGFGAKTLATSAPLYFAGSKVHLPDGLFDGTVGAGLLSPHKITFDFHDNKFWID
jgi:hypothetical protein